MKISVVIPTYNSEETIEKCLISLSKQTHLPHEVIVVDGGSADSTIEKVKRLQNVKLVLSKQPGLGSSRNKGAEIAVGDIIFFCDSDCLVDRRTLEYHSGVYKRRDDIVGVMGSIRRAGIKTRVSDFVQKQIFASEWLGNLRQNGTLISHLSCANFTMDKYIFLKKKFREDLVSYEDIELFIRLKKTELKVFYEPRAVVYHHHPTTIDQLFKRFMWYGEGFFQVDKIHGKDFRDRYRFFSPARYIDFPESCLQEAVFSNNRLLCNGCMFDSLQKCRIRNPQLMKNKIETDVDLHRVTCLATAAGILKKRTHIDYEPTVREFLGTNRRLT
jgi:glycosyltransferase involved in cell wall biosynthesis